MSEEKLPAAVLAVEGDISGFEAKMAQAEAVAKRFEQGATAAAGRAATALKKTGDGAEEGANKMDAATRRTIASLERQIAQLELSRSGYQAFLASQRGVAEEIYGPLVGRLNQAEAKQRAVAVQQREAAGAALQLGAAYKLTGQQATQLSYQLNDLFVQIVSGGNPLLALVQQGSQLNGTFGGFAGTMRALGTIITPVTVGLTAGVATVGALALAYKQGSGEQDAFARSLVLTGNAVGLTTDGLHDMAKAVGSVVGTRGLAAEVLATLAGSAGMAGSSLQLATEAAIRLQKVGGPAVEATTKQFAALARDPAKAAARLNEEANFLTIELYRQIRALEEQGRQQDAAALAVEAYARTVNGRAKELEERLGSLESAWMTVAGAAKTAWDNMLNIGRPETLADRLAGVERAIQANARRTDRADSIGPSGRRKGADARDAELRLQADELRRMIYEQGEMAAAEAASAESTRKAVKAEGEREQQLKRTQQEMQRLQEAGRKLLADAAEQLQLTQAEASSRGALTDAQKDALRALTALRDGTVALSDAQKRQLVDTLEARLATEALSRARKEAADIQQAMDRLAGPERSAAEDLRRQVQAQLEANAAIGQTTEQLRALEAAKLDNAEADAQLRLADALATGNVTAAEQIERQIADLQRLRQARLQAYQLTDSAAMREQAERAAASARKAFDDLFDPTRAKSFGEALSEAFGNVGNTLGRVTSLLGDYGRKQEEIERARAGINQDNPYETYYNGLRLASEEQRNQVQLYGQLIGASKGFFEEGSKGYRTMQALEAAFTIAQLAGAFTRSTAAATEAVLTQGKGDPYTAWARMAAMAAAVAQLGFATGWLGSSGGGVNLAERQAATGTGTVLGAATSEKSDSIARNIALLEDTARAELDYSRGMLDSLRSIEASLGGLGSLVVRSAGGGIAMGEGLGITTGLLGRNRGDPMLNAMGFSPIASERISQAIAGWFMGPVGVALVKPLQALWGKTTRDIGDAGLSIMGSMAQLMGGGGVQRYADVETTTSSWFGLRKKTTVDTVYGEVEEQIARQFGLVFASLGDTITASAGLLGADVGAAFQAQLQSFVVDVPKLSLKGLEGDALQEAISAAISAQADQLASALMPGLAEFQVIGEGYYETVVRVASGIELAAYQLDLLGISAVDYTAIARKQGDVTAEIVRQSITGYESLGGALTSVGAIVAQLDGTGEDLARTYSALVDVRAALLGVGIDSTALTTTLIRGAGGLDALGDALSTYSQEYFSQAERMAGQQAALVVEFAKIGVGMPATREAYRELVTQTAAAGAEGQRTAGKLLGLAGALDELFDVADAAAERRATERLSLEQRLLQAQGDTTELRRREREALDEANRALYDQVLALEDQRAAADAAAQSARANAAAWSSMAGNLDDGVRTAFGAVADLIEGERRNLESAAEAEVRALESQASTIRSAWEGLFGSLKSSIDSLLQAGSVDGGRDTAMRTLQQAARDLREGRTIDTDAVRAAAGTAARVGTDPYASRLEYQRAVAGTRSALADVLGGARDRMTSELGQIAAAQVAVEKRLAEQTQTLDDQLAQARRAAESLVRIDTGVQTLGQAMAALASAISATRAFRGEGGEPTNQWLRNGNTEVWAAAGGAVGARPAGSEDWSELVIKGKQSSFSGAEARAWITDAIIGGREGDIVMRAIAEGLDSASLDALMSWQPGTALAEARRRGLPAFEAGTAYVPSTGLALMHRGERVLTAPDNAEVMRILRGEGRSQALVQELRALREAVSRLEASHGTKLDAIAVSSRRTADDVETLAVFGLPAEVTP